VHGINVGIGGRRGEQRHEQHAERVASHRSCIVGYEDSEEAAQWMAQMCCGWPREAERARSGA
jgi:hypothetical protein